MQRIQGKGSRYSYYCNQCDTTFRSLAEANKHKSCKPTKQHGKKDNTSNSADDER